MSRKGAFVSVSSDSDGVIRYRDAKGRTHNPGGPALIQPDRATFWMVTGRDPSEKWRWWFGYREWWLHGRLHRTDGPAVVYGNGTVEYWVEGSKLSEKEFHQQYPVSLGKTVTDNRA